MDKRFKENTKKSWVGFRINGTLRNQFSDYCHRTGKNKTEVITDHIQSLINNDRQ